MTLFGVVLAYLWLFVKGDHRRQRPARLRIACAADRIGRALQHRHLSRGILACHGCERHADQEHAERVVRPGVDLAARCVHQRGVHVEQIVAAAWA